MCDRPSEWFPYTCAGPTRPVLVVDPAEARESGIAAVHALEAREPDPSVEQYVDAVIAALAGQGQP